MKKQDFIDSLEAIINEPINLTGNSQSLKEQTAVNGWSIAVPDKLKNQITISEFQEVILKVRESRRKQINESRLPLSLMWYSWYDCLTKSYRFNLLSCKHEHFTFRTNVEFVDNEREIIELFLHPKPIEIAFENLLADHEEVSSQNLIRVYREELSAN
jgi:hypothetical protein